MTKPSLVVIGASAGGVDTLMQWVRDLPARLPAAIAVTAHLPSHGRAGRDQDQAATARQPAQVIRPVWADADARRMVEGPEVGEDRPA